MLKLSTAPEEVAGAAVMAWWAGQGAAEVWAAEGDALLIERSESGRSLADLAFEGLDDAGLDDEATRRLCAVADALHAPRQSPPPPLFPLAERFEALLGAGGRFGAAIDRAAAIAGALLAEPRDLGALHGDLHHGNVLDFGARGWRAIDPKGVLGERGFDYANLFRNPPARAGAALSAVARERFSARISIVATEARLERGRLLRWIAAWCGLSAVWSLVAGQPADAALETLDLALAAIDR